jgi:hypothetical protein
MNNTNPIYDTLSKVAKESNAAIVDVASFTKNFGKIRHTMVEFTEKLHAIVTVAIVFIQCDLIFILEDD